ncbi:hypothetical protein CONLIGDRAFT_686719 [Coniochaeta ligniaria NRRL 30616]|uniref:Uncharacterized protein n=1 Tax=Coniochaeta ligniaria NRRL 30616 TaxID=1408157 RepID=A0A1J7IQ90_9PEZI|nr:hypothetical protein CONLIGDRAFT_686719 [Coniochaeta ligniaria NRRL 30616]
MSSTPAQDASKGAGQPSINPGRTNSEPMAGQSLEEMEEEVQRLKQSLADKQSQFKAKHPDSSEAAWWGSDTSVVATERQIAELQLHIQYRLHQSRCGNQSFEQWSREDNTGWDLTRKSSAISLMERMYRGQPTSLQPTPQLEQTCGSCGQLLPPGPDRATM